MPTNSELNDLTLGMDVDDNVSPHTSSNAGAATAIASCSNSPSKFIHFNIHFDQRIFDIRLTAMATIGKYPTIQ